VRVERILCAFNVDADGRFIDETGVYMVHPDGVMDPHTADVIAWMEAHPREAWEVYESECFDRLTGPWEVFGRGWIREEPGSKLIRAEVSRLPDCPGYYWAVYDRTPVAQGRCDTPEAARAAADAALREAGYILVGEDDDGS